MDQLEHSSRRAQAVWRHEFGHHMDHMSGPVAYRFGSNTNKFEAARRSDLQRLQKASGQSNIDMSATATRGADEAAILARKPLGARRKALREMSQRAGLDQGEVEQFLTREGPLGLLSGGERDAVVWRFMAAWDRKDAQGLIDVLLWENRMRLVSRKESATLINRAMKAEKGVGMLLSDLAHGATKGRAFGSFRHKKAYYEERIMTGGRETEIFANVAGISGESEFAERMVKHFSRPCIRK